MNTRQQQSLFNITPTISTPLSWILQMFLKTQESPPYLSHEHLKDENAEPPPVDRPRVRRLCEHLRGKELRRATERARPVTEPHPLLAQAEVCDLEITLRVQKQVIQLQISETNEHSFVSSAVDLFLI